MTKNDFMRLVSIVKSTYRAQWTDNQDVLNVFFNFCNQFDYDTCKAAIIDLIENGADDGVPVTLNVIERKIEREASIRRRPDTQKPQKVCPNCKGLGYTLKTYPTGVDYLTPCPCPVGREKYQSYFWSEEDEQEYWDDQQRHGKTKPQYMTAPAEAHRQAKYDEKQTAVYEEVKRRAANGSNLRRTKPQVHG